MCSKFFIQIFDFFFKCVDMKNKEKKKKKKKVSFAEDVMEPSGNNVEYRRKNRKSKLEDGRRRIQQTSQVL